ncbi:MAG: glycoside hydrolase family 95 protein [Phycisphaerae bacterium]|nr:glycoside hydrolase family 95 protein [Phycisphaerae bacterium]
MRSSRKYLLAVCAALVAVIGVQRVMADESEDRAKLKLWYRQPAKQWTEALPVGNGQLGAMVFGGVEKDRLQLNEKSLWSGSPQDADNPEALPALHEVRKLIFEGRYTEADALAAQKLVCKGEGSGRASGAKLPYGSYQTLGDLTLVFSGSGEISDYRRELDLDTAIAKTSYRWGDAMFTREVFSSAADGVLVVRLTCDKPDRISVTADLRRAERFTTSPEGTDRLTMTGQMNDGKNTFRGIEYVARLRAIAEGGTTSTLGTSLHVKGANTVTLLLTAGTDYRPLSTDYRGGAPMRVTAAKLAEAALHPYSDLRKRHVTDYQRLFRRVSLDLGKKTTPPSTNLPTDERIKAVHDGAVDPELTALYFQFGRYLLSSSSRPGTRGLRRASPQINN